MSKQVQGLVAQAFLVCHSPEFSPEVPERSTDQALMHTTDDHDESAQEKCG